MFLDVEMPVREENSHVDRLAPLESFASILFLFLIVNLLGKRCNACLKLQH